MQQQANTYLAHFLLTVQVFSFFFFFNPPWHAIYEKAIMTLNDLSNNK